MIEEPLVSISEASHILGVSEAALRQWTDTKRVRAFITPGGHRRYSRSDLRRFVSSHQKTLGVKDLVVELQDTVPQLKEIAHSGFHQALWYSAMDEESRKAMAGMGRRLFNLIIRYITEPNRRDETLELARGVGSEFGQTLAAAGLSLTDAVEAFIQHRDPIIRTTAELMRRRESIAGRVVEAIPSVVHVMDTALVSLVAAHQEDRNAPR